MKHIITAVLLISMLIIPVNALDIDIPQVPKEGELYMPENTDSFGEGIYHIFKEVMQTVRPDITQACQSCAVILAVILLMTFVSSYAQNSIQITELAGIITISITLLAPAGTLIRSGIATVESLSNYGKLLLPAMATATAAQGGITTSTALYVGTGIFCTFISGFIAKVMIPMLYIYAAVSIGSNAFEAEALSSLKKFMKGTITWSLKIAIYVFIAYISITGVITGNADSTAVKATKMAISGVIPVVGSMISDASETLLISAATVKNTAGIYGLLAILSITAGPFLITALNAVLLKATSAISAMIGSKRCAGVVSDFSDVMGFLLATTGTMCVLLMISIVCFLKGVPI